VRKVRGAWGGLVILLHSRATTVSWTCSVATLEETSSASWSSSWMRLGAMGAVDSCHGRRCSPLVAARALALADIAGANRGPALETRIQSRRLYWKKAWAACRTLTGGSRRTWYGAFSPTGESAHMEPARDEAG